METVQVTKCQLHVTEAAVVMGCSAMKVYGLIRSGKLLAHKEGKAWKIRVVDLETYLDSIPPQNQ